MSAADRVRQIVAKNAVVMFSTRTCPYCVRAKKLLTTLTKDMAVYDIDSIADGDALHSAVIEMTGHETVPAIWVKGQFVGGCTDVEGLHKQGRLTTMLA
jgi:glutaredoxin 3